MGRNDSEAGPEMGPAGASLDPEYSMEQLQRLPTASAARAWPPPRLHKRDIDEPAVWNQEHHTETDSQ